MQRLAATILAEQAQVQKRIAAAQKAWPQAAEDVKQQLRAPAAARLPRAHALGAAAAFPALPEGGGAAARQAARRPGARRAAHGRARAAGAGLAARACVARQAGRRAAGAELEQFGWLLEELRVSLFAQELKTPVPVSAKRLAKLWQSMRK